MSICGKDTDLDALKDKQGGLDKLLSGGKDALGDMSSALSDLKDGIKLPENPKPDSLQDKLSELKDILNPIKLKEAIDEINDKFGDAVDSVGDLITSSLTGGDVCTLAPNVEVGEDGVAKEQPAEAKVPGKEVAEAEEAQAAIESESAAVNSQVFDLSMEQAIKRMRRLVKRRDRGSLYKSVDAIMWAILPELYLHISEVSGTPTADLGQYDYTVAPGQSIDPILKRRKESVTAKFRNVDQFFGRIVTFWQEEWDRISALEAFTGSTTLEDGINEWVARKLDIVASEEEIATAEEQLPTTNSESENVVAEAEEAAANTVANILPIPTF